jgi:hypothetical protein
MLGFQLLNDEQKAEAAHIAAMAGFTLHDASHIWYQTESQTVVLRLPSGPVDVMVEPACEGSYS